MILGETKCVGGDFLLKKSSIKLSFVMSEGKSRLDIKLYPSVKAAIVSPSRTMEMREEKPFLINEMEAFHGDL
jgi:hypothetical protein